MFPKRIRQTTPAELLVTWHDGHESTFRLQELRQQCPCAACKGESILWKSYGPAPLPVTTHGIFKIKEVQQVGQYAIHIAWGDGHNTGIYTYEYLRSICSCEECKSKRNQVDDHIARISDSSDN
jgi:DUF971 family protein